MRRPGHQCQCEACVSGEDHPERESHRAMNRLMEELDERQRRLYAATEAQRRGWGGCRVVRQITGISQRSLKRGMDELAGRVAPPPAGRVRGVGGGRPAIEVAQPGIEAALEALVEGQTAGDPEGQGRWVRTSLRQLEAALEERGYEVSHQTVARMLADKDFALRVNAKRKSGPSHPDRNRQFEHLAAQVESFRGAGDPVISVDTKKRNSSATSRTPGGPGAGSPTR